MVGRTATMLPYLRRRSSLTDLRRQQRRQEVKQTPPAEVMTAGTYRSKYETRNDRFCLRVENSTTGNSLVESSEFLQCR